MDSYLIIGCGRFGSQAAIKLLGRHPRAEIRIVDRNRNSLKKISNLSVTAIVSDGNDYLSQFILEGGPADYIVPAVPYHLAFEFILSQLKLLGVKRVEVPPLRGLPNSMPGKTGDLYVSHADFLCPDNCPEPSHFCTVTGEKRPTPLFEILRDLRGPFESKVIRSLQLGEGVGGFRPKVLMNLIETIKKRRGSNRPFLISTACRCHGVISALSI